MERKKKPSHLEGTRSGYALFKQRSDPKVGYLWETLSAQGYGALQGMWCLCLIFISFVLFFFYFLIALTDWLFLYF